MKNHYVYVYIDPRDGIPFAVERRSGGERKVA